jgi:electron transfer flavoprotein beta subunit
LQKIDGNDMKIIVPFKPVIDAYAKIRVKSDQTGVESHNVKVVINPFDEIALEQALRCKEDGLATEVVLVTVGGDGIEAQCRSGLALGADRAILVRHSEVLEPLNIAKVLQAIVLKENADLVIMGKQTIDGDHNQTGQMLAACLAWPQATYASAIEFRANEVQVQREVDAGLHTIVCPLPAVITVDLRLNTPRYASLPNMMKAKQKPLDVIPLADLGLELKTHLEVIKVEPPVKRRSGEMVADVATLVKKLREEAKVL